MLYKFHRFIRQSGPISVLYPDRPVDYWRVYVVLPNGNIERRMAFSADVI